MTKPQRRPGRPQFSSGPTAKRPGWSARALDDALLGRSHRSAPGKRKLVAAIDHSRRILGMPREWRVAIMAGSDTGAFEAAMWSLLGARGVDVIAFDSFGKDWLVDLRDQLRIEDMRAFEADYGELPDLGAVDCARDVVLTWNGTTSGVRIPDADWIPEDRSGLVLCDATSAVFATELPWDRLDVVTWSWQKVLGGEAQHGMLALSPRAQERLRHHQPPWPVPKIFRLTSKGGLNEGLFQGETINTPSMLAVEDVLDALGWAEAMGGLEALIRRSRLNFAAVEGWVERSHWVRFLVPRPELRSTTSICLTIADDRFDDAAKRRLVADIVRLLDEEGVAHDIAAYRSAPPGFRLWGGATVETSDLEALLPWLDWGFARCAPRHIS